MCCHYYSLHFWFTAHCLISPSLLFLLEQHTFFSDVMRALLHKIAQTPQWIWVKALTSMQEFILSRESVLLMLSLEYFLLWPLLILVSVLPQGRESKCVLTTAWQCVSASTEGSSVIPPKQIFFVFSLIFNTCPLRDALLRERLCNNGVETDKEYFSTAKILFNNATIL